MWGIGLELVTMLGMILTFVLLGRSLGADGYGGYVALYAIVGPLVTLAASGITLALLQHVVRDGESLSETARSCASLTLALGIPLTGVGAVIAFLIVEEVTTLAIVSILLTEFVATPMLMVAATTVQAADSFTGAAKIRIAWSLSRMCLVVVLFVTNTLSVTSLGASSLVVSAVLGVVVLIGVGRTYGFILAPGRIHWSHLKTNVLYSVGISGASLNNEGDKTILAANGFQTATGQYGAAYRIVNLGMVPISSLIGVSHRRFLEHEEGARGQHLQRAIRFAKLSGAYGLVVGLALILAAPLLPLVVGDDFDQSVTMVRWLAPLVLLRALTMFPLNALMGLGHTLLRSVVIVANAAIAIVLYIVLIPTHSWRGAVAGTLISETLEMVSIWATLIWCQRQADRAIDEAPGNGSVVAQADPARAQESADAAQHLGDGEAPLEWVAAEEVDHWTGGA